MTSSWINIAAVIAIAIAPLKLSHAATTSIVVAAAAWAMGRGLVYPCK